MDVHPSAELLQQPDIERRQRWQPDHVDRRRQADILSRLERPDPLASPRTIKHTDFEQLVVLAAEFKEIGNDVFAKVTRKITPAEFKKL